MAFESFNLMSDSGRFGVNIIIMTVIIRYILILHRTIQKVKTTATITSVVLRSAYWYWLVVMNLSKSSIHQLCHSIRQEPKKAATKFICRIQRQLKKKINSSVAHVCSMNCVDENIFTSRKHQSLVMIHTSDKCRQSARDKSLTGNFNHFQHLKLATCNTQHSVLLATPHGA